MIKLDEGLLYDAYVCNKILDAGNINCWYSSMRYVLQSLDIQNLNTKLNKLN